MFKTSTLFYIILLVAIGYSFYVTTRYYNDAVFNDLKCRTVATRTAEASKDAYFHTWNPATDSLSLLDPHRKHTQVVSGNTITPITMLVLSKLQQQKFSAIVPLWIFISYAALFTIFLLFYFKQKASYLNIIALLLLLSSSWHFHILKGQVYIFYTLLAILAILFYSKKRFILAGLLAGLLVTMRFPFLLLLLPMLFYKRTFSISTILATIFFIGISSVYYPNSWSSYFTSMQIHSNENAFRIPEQLINYSIPKPTTMEGIPNNTSPFLENYFKSIEPDIISVQKLLLKLQLPSSTIFLASLFGLLIIGLFYFFFRKIKPQKYTYVELQLFAAIGYFMVDYFLPAPRFSYNFVQILIPLYVVANAQIKPSKTAFVFLTAGLLLNIYKLNFLPESFAISELCCIIGLLLILKSTIKNEIR